MQYITPEQASTMSYEDCLANLRQRYDYYISNGSTAMQPELYMRPGDLENFWLAVSMWAKDAPPRYAVPDLSIMLSSIGGGSGANQRTFMQLLTHNWENYAAWMMAQNRDPLHANETREQRRARKARESMARLRERRREDGGDAQANVRALYDAYMAACAERKAAYDAYTANVVSTKTAWEQAKAAL